MTRADHNTGSYAFPTLCEKRVGSSTSPVNHFREENGDGAYGLSSLPEETRMPNK